MATASSTANDLTRQQLDELDALLQRMLSLPINPADPTPPAIPAATLAAFTPPLPPMNLTPPIAIAVSPPTYETTPSAPPTRRPDPPAPAPRLFAPPVEEPARFEPPQAPATRQTTPPKAQPATRPEPKVEHSPPPAPAPVVARPGPPPPVEVESAILPVATDLPFGQPESEPVTAATEPVPLVLMPMVLFNRLLNGGLGLLGMPGRVLRSGFVKNLFGLAGLGLLAYTGAKVAQVHGWITFPIELPWPR